jgi:hypothetical protein
MEERHKNGISINNHSPLGPDLTTSLGTFKVQEEPTTCKSGALTQDGSNCSCTKMNNLSMSRTKRYLMSQVEKIKKDKLLSSGEITVRRIRNGRSSTLTKLERLKLRDLMKNSASTLTDHSTSDQDSQ